MPAPHYSIVFFTGQMPFLLPNQQCQSTEGISYEWQCKMQKMGWLAAVKVMGNVTI